MTKGRFEGSVWSEEWEFFGETRELEVWGKGKLWKEFRRNRFLTLWTMCGKCHDFTFVLVWNEEER